MKAIEVREDTSLYDFVEAIAFRHGRVSKMQAEGVNEKIIHSKSVTAACG